ncbi:MAG: virulence factor [Sphingomonadales bacterium]|nr:virulence factor [Sphingomonadales bacterium]MDE2168728.1 virulence factor [Sphingomonadales bacterium]
MYAIAYDLNAEAALRHGAYEKIARVLAQHGFSRQQGSVFYGTPETQASHCFRAVLEINRKFSWFWEVVRDMRMLRIDENDDLLSVVPRELRFDQGEVA